MIACDNPRTIRTCDFLVEDSDDYTEILLMDWAAFQYLVYRKNLRFEALCHIFRISQKSV